MQEITITVERYTELIEKEIRIRMLEETVKKESVYVSKDDLLFLLGIKAGDDE